MAYGNGKDSAKISRQRNCQKYSERSARAALQYYVAKDVVLDKQKLDEDEALYYETLIDIREEKNITWKDDKLKKQYNKLMDQLLESAKTEEQ